jgi:hypothetical protein
MDVDGVLVGRDFMFGNREAAVVACGHSGISAEALE